MKLIQTTEAVGHILCHDLTRIVEGAYKGAQFKKGHIVTQEDIPLLLSMGKEHLYVWEMQAGFLHENDAAERLCGITANQNMSRTASVEGKIELFAECEGLFDVDIEQLDAINAIEDIVIASRHRYSVVEKGDKLAGMRVVPLAVEEDKLVQAEQIAHSGPIFDLLPFKLKTAGVIATGSEVFHGRIKDTFTPVIKRKLARFGIQVVKDQVTEDGLEQILLAIATMRREGVDLIICTGGMSVDPDDNTPGAIRSSGAEIVTYGAPVLPGSMFLLGYYPDGMPIMGLPGCVMYSKATIFDLLLPRIAAAVPVTKTDIVKLGHGGLCLNCNPCHFPICPFGR